MSEVTNLLAGKQALLEAFLAKCEALTPEGNEDFTGALIAHAEAGQMVIDKCAQIDDNIQKATADRPMGPEEQAAAARIAHLAARILARQQGFSQALQSAVEKEKDITRARSQNIRSIMAYTTPAPQDALYIEKDS